MSSVTSALAARAAATGNSGSAEPYRQQPVRLPANLLQPARTTDRDPAEHHAGLGKRNISNQRNPGKLTTCLLPFPMPSPD